jgi:hypothetical protein
MVYTYRVILNYYLNLKGGARWCNLLRLCATSRKSRYYDLGVDSASNRNDRQEYFLRCKDSLWLTTLPPSCADCLKIWYPQTPGTLRPCPGLQRHCFTLPLLVLQTFLALYDVNKAACELLCSRTTPRFMYVVLSKTYVSMFYNVTNY